MNLQLDAYLLEHRRRELTKRFNAKIINYEADEIVKRPNIIKQVQNWIQLIGQIQAIRIHVTLDWKEASDHLRTNALKTG